MKTANTIDNTNYVCLIIAAIILTALICGKLMSMEQRIAEHQKILEIYGMASKSP